jgi:hypothetical protein
MDEGYPTPGCFFKRVWNDMKTKELSFLCLQRSLQEYQRKGDRSEKRDACEDLENGMLRRKEVKR